MATEKTQVYFLFKTADNRGRTSKSDSNQYDNKLSKIGFGTADKTDKRQKHLFRFMDLIKDMLIRQLELKKNLFSCHLSGDF